jgi:Lipocalin-like domain
MQSVTKSLIGTWKLKSFQFEFENKERENAYDKASGFLIIGSDGRFTAILADDARKRDDPEASLFQRMMAYSGSYRIQGDDTVVIDVDFAWHPSWLGSEQTRYFKIEGDTLSIVSAPQTHPKRPGQMLRGIITWTRE